jgi:hypothetical protein
LANQPSSNQTTPPAPNLLAAWIVIIIFLLVLANFESTEQLAAAFAYLILVAVIFAQGQAALDGLTNFINSSFGVK